ncbi:MAG: peroxiredoxin [Gammaproteobacteria bacterium]|nr:peroxiredoxin [Gammaproteobacteria bacterium]MYE82455.1 peroxiredoxin [Gammaproteobacteria bacterium]
MAIQEGDQLPDATFFVMQDGRPSPRSTQDLFGGKKVVLFAVPGAFTPLCSEQHLPGYVTHADALREKGVDSIVCTAVNDAFVMDAWGQDRQVGDMVMAADGNGAFAKALGLELDATGFGLGVRSERYAMVVEDGTVTKLSVEGPNKFEVSKAEAILEAL